jgi:hypothetical protein
MANRSWLPRSRRTATHTNGDTAGVELDDKGNLYVAYKQAIRPAGHCRARKLGGGKLNDLGPRGGARVASA